MNLKDMLESIEYYGASKESMERVNEIFTSGDPRYRDPEYEVIVAGFLDNGAIDISMRVIGPRIFDKSRIHGPQKEMKAIAIDLLKKEGFKDIKLETGFRGGIVEVLGLKKKSTIAVECGPCNVKKAISYLEKDGTDLWILKITESGYSLHIVKRSANWRNLIKRHNANQFKKSKIAINMAFPGRRLPRILSSEEVAEMFRVSELSPRDSMLLKCMYYLGMKSSEVRTFRASDVDFRRNVVRISKSYKKKPRYVPIPEGFSKELKGFIRDKGGSVFPGRNREGTLSDRHIRRIVKRHAEGAGIRKFEEIHPHTLRHSYATHLQNSGVPLNVIQAMLGHERIETTTIYTHMGIDKAREFINQAFLKPLPRAPRDFDGA